MYMFIWLGLWFIFGLVIKAYISSKTKEPDDSSMQWLISLIFAILPASVISLFIINFIGE